MIRLSSVFWLLLVSATALATFAVKYEVQTLDDRLADAQKATGSENRELHVLDAEWAYLNRPDMLAAMNQRFLSLVPITQQQLQTAITDIPLRPAPQPAPPPAAVAAVAALEEAPIAAPLPAVESSEGAAPDTSAPPTKAENRPRARSTARGPEASEKLALAAPVKPLLVKAAAVSAAPPRAQPLDNRALDQLITRIAAGR